MNILFRVDASLQMGTGHVMRCLTLAQALRDRGAHCRFICREHPGHLLEQIRLAGFEAIALPLADQSDRALAYKTLITQEMLKKGYLASTSIYVCTEHKPEVVDGYFAALDPVFGLIKQCEQGRDVMGLLEGPLCHAGFKRLN